MNISSTTNIGHQDKVEVRVTVDCESYTSSSHTRNPSVGNRDNTSFVLSNALKNRLREIEMMKRRVTPTTSVIGKSVVRRTEIGGCDNDSTR
jgi:hypothetical protein